MEAPNVIEFEVTYEDLTNGHRNDPYRCPMALAIKRATGRYSVGVGPYEASVDYGERKQVTKAYAKKMPAIYDHKYKDFVTSVDIGHPVLPFKGRLTIQHG